MLYPLLRPLLFRLDAERAHQHTLRLLDAAHSLHLLSLALPKPVADPVKAMGISFPNAVGLAAGLDKDGAHIPALSDLGFGFIEVGTVTPLAQSGNPTPRMFRIAEHQGIINRMGFNNQGVKTLVANIERSGFKGVLGVNIGKNATTPIDQAASDYLSCMDQVYQSASYITINISSPNTKNLRQLQQGDELSALLLQLKNRQRALAERHGHYVPLAVKIAPDLEAEAIAEVAQLLIRHEIDGVIAGNTTLSRSEIAGHAHAGQAGGLSGAPLKQRSTALIRELARQLDGALPIIGVGGIFSGEDAVEKIRAGATLVQLYTGLVYRGPALIAETAQALARERRTHTTFIKEGSNV
jgi:dihydroorotate dehydrogenase